MHLESGGQEGGLQWFTCCLKKKKVIIPLDDGDEYRSCEFSFNKLSDFLGLSPWLYWSGQTNTINLEWRQMKVYIPSNKTTIIIIIKDREVAHQWLHKRQMAWLLQRRQFKDGWVNFTAAARQCLRSKKKKTNKKHLKWCGWRGWQGYNDQPHVQHCSHKHFA